MGGVPHCGDDGGARAGEVGCREALADAWCEVRRGRL